MLLKDPNNRYKGVKTGQTPNAGSCLCSQYVDEKLGVKFMCVVIGTMSNKHRNTETTRLINWWISTQVMKNKKPNKMFTQKRKFHATTNDDKRVKTSALKL